MRKSLFFVLFASLLFFTQCSPKVKDAVTQPSDMPGPVDESFRSKAPEAGPAPQIELGEYDEFTLANGLKVFVVENHKLPRISWRLFIDIPSFMENESVGYAQMAGALLATGTKNKTKAEIDEARDFIGASLSTNAGGLFAASLTKHKDALLNLVSDVLYNPAFPEEEFEKLKKQTLSGLAAGKDDPGTIAGNVSQVLRYGKDHPYGELQTEETVENITLDQCRKFYQKYFKPNISYLIIVGDITPDEAKRSAEKYFGKWQKGTVDKPSFETPERPGEAKVAFVNKTGAVQSTIRVTYPVDLKPGSADAIKARVMNTLFGGFFRSRLNDNLREDKAYTYGVSSTLSPNRLVGYLAAGGDVRNEVTDSAIVEFLYEMNRLREEPVSAEELSLVKSVITGQFARQLESPQTIANYALNIARYNLPQDYYKTYLEELNSVTAEDIMAMAKKYLTPDNAYILVVGNKGEVAEKLEKFDADGKIDFYDRYGNEIKAGGVALPEGMTAEGVIGKYLAALGGKDKLAAIQDVTTKMSANIQGQNLDVLIKQKTSGKYYMSINMSGMTVQEQKYDGTQGQESAMGQSQKIEGEQELASMKRQSMPFPELFYKEWGYELALKGVDQIEGKNAIAVEISTPEGEKFTDFFDMETYLKIRSVSTTAQDSPGGAVTIVNDSRDYREVEGVKMPFEMSVSGEMPFPLVMKVKEVNFNTGVADSEFEIK